LIVIEIHAYFYRNTIQQDTKQLMNSDLSGVGYFKEILESMLLSIQRKGKKVLMNEEELQEYMSARLNELTGLGASIVTALIMVTLIVVLNYIKARFLYYYALILLPLLGRFYIGDLLRKWLRKKFKELLDA
jgi:hypothetical protein